MEDYVGWLKPNQEDALGEALDDAIELKGVGEMVDGFVAKAAIRTIDNRLLVKIPTQLEVKQEISSFADGVIANDLDVVTTAGATIVNKLADIPGLNEDEEQFLAKGLLEALIAAGIRLVKKRKS